MIVYSAFMKAQMASGFSWTSQKMGVVLLYRSPTVVSPGDDIGNPNYHSPYDTQSLLNLQGFQEVSTVASPTYIPYPGTGNQQNAGPDTSVPGITSVVYGADYNPIPNTTGAKPVYVQAALFYVVGPVAGVTDPWVMITDEAFDAVVYPGFKITGPPDPTSGTPVRRFFSYAVRGTTVDITPAQILRSPGTLRWESSRLQHVYLLPQRVNYVPNPSFENVSPFGWRSDGTMTRTVGGVDSASNYFMRTTGHVLESIPVPRSALYRFSAFVRKVNGTKVNLGLVPYDSTYRRLGGTVWVRAVGSEWPLYGTWTRYDGLIAAPDDAAAVVPRIEADGSFDCDLVLLEAVGALHPYWDGASVLGLTGDFSWQGTAHQSYSCWYNNRYQTAARLFGRYLEGEITALPALVLDWVPTGTTVYTHWDVLSDVDTKHPLEDWSLRTYNRLTGCDITGTTFTPAGTPTSVGWNYSAGTGTINQNGTAVTAAAGAFSSTLAAFTVGSFIGYALDSSGSIVAHSAVVTTYDAAWAAINVAGFAPAYIIQRINAANVASSYLVYDVRQR